MVSKKLFLVDCIFYLLALILPVELTFSLALPWKPHLISEAKGLKAEDLDVEGMKNCNLCWCNVLLSRS